MNTENSPTQIDTITETAHQHRLKAHKCGDLSLTITTLILVLVSLYFNIHFAPFIILLMSSRIGTSIYTIVKTTSKKEIRKLILWLALFAKSAISYFHFLGGMA